MKKNIKLPNIAEPTIEQVVVPSPVSEASGRSLSLQTFIRIDRNGGGSDIGQTANVGN
jgi:hypothetical protein